MSDEHYNVHYNGVGNVITHVIMHFEHMNNDISHTVFKSGKLTFTRVWQGSANVKNSENIEL